MKSRKIILEKKKDGFNSYSEVIYFRAEWDAKGYELINITELCELKLGHSGSCNNFNEPDEKCYHIQIWYRDENIAIITPTSGYVIDNDKYIIFKIKDKFEQDNEFIIFRKVKK